MQDLSAERLLRPCRFHNNTQSLSRQCPARADMEVSRMHLVDSGQKQSADTLPVGEKYMLTIKEAASYFNIGTKKMRRIAEDNLGNIAVFCGNRFLIVRPKFEEFILNSSEI